MRRLCSLYKNVDFVSSNVHIGHSGGDLGAVSRGIPWAKAKGLKVLAKLSQRFICISARWLQDASRELLDSEMPLAGERCIEGPHRFPLRTEAFLMDVDAWNEPGLLEYLAPRRVHNAAEAIVDHANRVYHNGRRMTWKLLGGPNRMHPNPNLLWHTSHPESAYRALAKQHGVDLGPDFNCRGSHTIVGYTVG
jgi:hypothetical protein